MRITLFFLLILFAACSRSKTPGGVLPPDKMQVVLWDYIRADVYANEFLRADSSLNVNDESAKLQLALFAKHKITKEQFYKSYQYYLNHKGQLKEVLDSVMAVQQREILKPHSVGPDSAGRRIRPAMLDSL